MRLNKSQGRMFKSVTHTGTYYRGCDHGCGYCWVDFLNISKAPCMVQKDKTQVLNVRDAVIFLNSTGDTLAPCIPNEWIKELIDWIKLQHPSNTFLIQSKNTRRLFGWYQNLLEISDRILLGTTVECIKQEKVFSNADSPIVRAYFLARFREMGEGKFKTFLSLEPLCRPFDPKHMLRIVQAVAPEMLEIGFDNYGHKHGLKLERPAFSDYMQFRRKLQEQGWSFEEKQSLKTWLKNHGVED